MSVKALGYVVIGTRDIEAWDRFLAGIVGAMPTEGPRSGVRLYRMDGRPFRFWVQQGDTEELLATGLELADEAAFERGLTAATAAGRPVERATAEEAAARRVRALARVRDPAGNGLELYWGDTRDTIAFTSPAGVSGFVTDPMGMGHVVFAAPNLEETHRFYREVLGMGDTDTPRFKFGGANDPGMGFAFMHGQNGRHHTIALGESPRPPSGCIHIMVEARTMDDVGRAHDRMRLAKIPVSATLGKHVNDAMTSFYMKTPSGFDLEFGCGGLVIDPATWKTTAHERISEWGHVWAWQAALEAERS
jgi:3,4-dihydroxy-9,10-secoandrosta-1,3,5(10)-triene-9,17-dione 4,5-dioxygenase